MKKILVGSFIGLIIFLCFLISLAPARTVLPWFTQGIPLLSLNNPVGTVWNTSLTSVSYQGRIIEDVSLRTSFWSLLFGRLNSNIKVNDKFLTFDGNIALSRQQISITDTRYQLEASKVLEWVRLPITELSGSFGGNISHIELTQNEIIKLEAGGIWQNAVVGYPNSTLELGDISYTLSRTEAGHALLTVTENPGVLDLKGTLEVGSDRQYQLNVSTQVDVPTHIKQWLTQLGRTENNRIFITWNGRLP